MIGGKQKQDTTPLHSAYIPIGERHYAKDRINQWKLQLPPSYDRQTQCVMTAHHLDWIESGGLPMAFWTC